MREGSQMILVRVRFTGGRLIRLGGIQAMPRVGGSERMSRSILWTQLIAALRGARHPGADELVMADMTPASCQSWYFQK